MLYELRHADVHNSRSLEVLNRRMEVALAVWQRIGIESVGFWSVLIGPTSPRLTYLLAWESLEQRERLWAEFVSDPGWKQAQQESAEDPVRRSMNSILRPVPNSPLARHDNQPPRLTGGLFELRILTYKSSAEQCYAAEWYLEKVKPQMEKHGMFLMGFWETYIGVSPQLTYMLVFESLAHRERAWASFHTDPDYPGLQDALDSSGQPLMSQTESSVMKGTGFSFWR